MSGEEDSAPESGVGEKDADVDDNNEADSDMIVIDAIGELDDILSGDKWETHNDLEDRENNDLCHEEIELSSDEEPDTNDGNDVSLVLLRRPPVIESQEAIDILDSDEEFPVCITEGSKPENVNIQEKKGRVAEYIEREGLGMIYAE